jgi:hypothetical protein
METGRLYRAFEAEKIDVTSAGCWRVNPFPSQAAKNKARQKGGLL